MEGNRCEIFIQPCVHVCESCKEGLIKNRNPASKTLNQEVVPCTQPPALTPTHTGFTTLCKRPFLSEQDVRPIRRTNRFDLSELIMPKCDTSKCPGDFLFIMLVGVGMIMFALSSFQIIIGVVFIHECPRQPFIPIYLCGFGAMFLLFFYCQCKHNTSNIVCNCVVAIFFICWFIAGSVTIFSIYKPSYKKTRKLNSYCNKTLYLFAFWSTNFLYGLLGVIGSCFFSFFFYSYCQQEEQQTQTTDVSTPSAPSSSEVSSLESQVQIQVQK
ncbi:transmembrane protein 272-like [Scomber scombrus]|uniref:Transmembrane protein 272-like n=1 Tax=Scomber scombrus TaxID=13677 RepID=A0AAV1N1U5_SCOSC